MAKTTKKDTMSGLPDNEFSHTEGTTVAQESAKSEPRYVKFTDVKLGDILVGLDDHDLDCIQDGTEYEVKQNERGRLFIACEEGEHYLDKDVDVHDYIRGLGVKAA